METLVSAGWLEDHLADPDLRVVDATVDVDAATGRVSSGRRRWEQAHIPGASFADLVGDFSDPDSPYPFTMPSAERFAGAAGRLGIGDGTRVVAYDARDSMWAARLWWMFRAFGFDDCALLDGGWTTWTAEGRPISTALPTHEPAMFTPHAVPDTVVDTEAVRRSLGDAGTCIIDALSRREFSGELAFYGRAGHIPGAINVPARRIIDRDTQRFRSESELREMFASALSAPRVITYCGGGVAAASDAFALRLIGHPNVAVYDGSLIEWCADPGLPLESGPA